MAQDASIGADHASAIDAARDQGLPVVGIIGAGVPVELIFASGATAVRLVAGHPGETPRADTLIGAGEGMAMRGLVERALDGSWAALDLLIITRQHEWLYYYLKEAVRLGEARLPPLHMHDFVFSTEPALRPYNRQRLARLRDVLERRIGKPIGLDSLQLATATSNRQRAVLRDIQRKRDEAVLRGTDAVRLIAERYTMPVDVFARRAAAPTLAPPAGAPRLLLLSSEPDEDAALHRAIEAAGVVVAAEDSEWGARSARPDLVLGDDPWEALLDDQLAAASGSNVSPRAARLAWAEAALHRADIGGVVFAIPPQDTRFGWDYPSLRDRAAAIGLPALVVRDDHRTDPGAITAAVRAFAATLGRAVTA